MIVNRLNFPQVFPLLTTSLRNSLFVSFDLEFTGLHVDPLLQNTAFDTSLHRYMKMRESISAFCPLQIGLCTFSLKDGVIEARPFSFVLFPMPIGDLDRVYSFQASSVDFLSTHGFDFNTTFKEGLGFVNRTEFAGILKRKKDKEARASYLQQGITHDMRAFAALCLSAVEQWNKETELVIDAKFMKRAAIQYAVRELERIHEVICEEVKGEDGFVSSISLKVGKRIQPDQPIRGFSEVLDHMHGKPLIGHNMFMDTMHLYDKFINPLPPTLAYFARAFHEEFPTVIDTKYMLQSSSVLKSFFTGEMFTLQDMYATVEKKKSSFAGKADIVIAEGFEGTKQAHDAGFDAFCTGSVFLRSCQLLKVTDLSQIFSNTLVDIFKNRIAVAGRKMPIKLDAEYMEESREDVFVLEKPTSLVSYEVMKAELEQRFGKIAMYKVYWSDSLLYIIPSSMESRESLLKAIPSTTSLEIAGAMITISSYADYVKAQGWRS